MKIKNSFYKYPPMDKARRTSLVPSKNVISVSPAEDPADYLYTGNGHYWLESAGGVMTDEIIVTEEHLYEPLWAQTPLPPDLRPYIDKIRQCVLDGKPELADVYIDKAQRDAGYEKYMNMDREIVYPIGSPRVHKAFSLNIRRDGFDETSVSDYLRWLDLESGATTTHFESNNGTYETKILASFQENMTAIRFTAPKQALCLSIDLRLPGGPNLYGVPTMVNASHTWIQEENDLILCWQYDPDLTSKGYYVYLHMVSEDGELSVSPEHISMQAGTSLDLYVKVIKVEQDFSMEGYKSHASFLSESYDFDRLEEDNKKILGEKMARSYIQLGQVDDYWLSGEELLKKCHSEQVLYPALMDKLYDMGRFYQIVDTGDIPPMWGQHNINTNLQVCAGNNTGLFDEMDVYFRYYETKFEDFRTNARLLFGARGLLASVHCDPDSGLFYHFSKTYPHYCWTGCLGWIYNEFWGYYLVTGDKDFLKNRVLPALEEIALFFEDYASLTDQDGKNIFVPSFSPEDPTPNPDYSTVTCKDIHATRINSVMDIAICREVLDNLITGSQILGINRDKIAHWETQRDHLPTYLTDLEGGLKEWAWESIEENYNHRHVSHHYDLWPGRAITVDKEPEAAQAILISNRKRGQQDDSAHGIIHRAFCALRLKDKEEFIQNLSQLISHGFVRRSLSTAHFPYRGQFPDLQGAMPGLLLEMCVYSEPGMIELLPALPEEFAEGQINGIWLYTFAKLEHMQWNPSELTARISSRKDQTLTIHLRNKSYQKCLINDKEYSLSDGMLKLSLCAGETVQIRLIDQKTKGVPKHL